MLMNEINPHGGDIYTYKNMLDFSVNINPFGIPDPVKTAVAKAIDNCTAYPDPYCRRLRERLAEEEKVPEECILCGNGAAELIYSFAYSLSKDKPALIVSPTFSEYQKALSAARIPSEYFMLEERKCFVLDDNIMNIDFSKYSALFICTPNNPTGITVRSDLLERLAATGIRLFCDMCFMLVLNKRLQATAREAESANKAKTDFLHKWRTGAYSSFIELYGNQDLSRRGKFSTFIFKGRPLRQAA